MNEFKNRLKAGLV